MLLKEGSGSVVLVVEWIFFVQVTVEHDLFKYHQCLSHTCKQGDGKQYHGSLCTVGDKQHHSDEQEAYIA